MSEKDNYIEDNEKIMANMETNTANMEMKVVAIKMSARMYEIYRVMHIYTVQ